MVLKSKKYRHLVKYLKCFIIYYLFLKRRFNSSFILLFYFVLTFLAHFINLLFNNCKYFGKEKCTNHLRTWNDNHFILGDYHIILYEKFRWIMVTLFNRYVYYFLFDWIWSDSVDFNATNVPKKSKFQIKFFV